MGIWDWFVGYDKAHGVYVTAQANERGKIEGKAHTLHEELTVEKWQEHLAGKRGVGVIALLANDTVRWCAGDIDQYTGLDHNAVARAVKDYPIVVFRSKSGGAHLVMFFREEVPAIEANEKCADIMAALGFGGCEIFPKQTSRAGPGDVGNWLNMPYFNADRTTRYAVNGERAMSYDECLAFIETKALTLEQFRSISVEPPSKKQSVLFESGPPCLQHLEAQGGFSPGTRNEGLYNVGVYLRKRFPDDWQDKLMKYNQELCDPPLGFSEIGVLAKSLTKKEYRYACNKSPISAFCNKKACLRRSFGVGETPGYDQAAEIGTITKYEGNPVYWVVEIEGFRIRLATDELLSQTLFARQCAEVLTRVPTAMPEPRWRRYLNDKMKHADIVPAPLDEETITGQFWVMVERFCTARAQGTTLDSVAANYPFTENGRTYFRGVALLDYLKRNGFVTKGNINREVWNLIEEGGGEKVTKQIRGHDMHLWSLPEFTQDMTTPKELPDMGAIDF